MLTPKIFGNDGSTIDQNDRRMTRQKASEKMETRYVLYGVRLDGTIAQISGRSRSERELYQTAHEVSEQERGIWSSFYIEILECDGFAPYKATVVGTRTLFKVR